MLIKDTEEILVCLEKLPHLLKLLRLAAVNLESESDRKTANDLAEKAQQTIRMLYLLHGKGSAARRKTRPGSREHILSLADPSALAAHDAALRQTIFEYEIPKLEADNARLREALREAIALASHADLSHNQTVKLGNLRMLAEPPETQGKPAGEGL